MKKTPRDFIGQDYQYGFITKIDADSLPKGLNEAVVAAISRKKNEPEWMLQWRLKAYQTWKRLEEPRWQQVQYPKIDYQDMIYYSAPKSAKDRPKSLDEIDPEILETYKKLGIPLEEQQKLAGIAVDAVFDSVSVATTFKDTLKKSGVIFCSFSEAVREHPDLIKKYLGSVVPVSDNFFAALNSAVFSDGSFVYIPKGVRCPLELSTYFRINAAETGQFERTLIVAEEGAYVSYLEGCFPAGEQVLTQQGWRNIEGIRPGDFVFDHLGNLKKVNAAMTRRYRGQLFEIRPVSRCNSFRLTAEHPVFSIRRENVLVKRAKRGRWLPEVDTDLLEKSKPEWIPASQLKKGDFLVVPKLHIKAKKIFTNDEIELLGFYLAEGSSYFNKLNKQQTIQFLFGLHEKKLVRHVCHLIRRVSERPVYVTEQPDRNGIGITFYSKDFSDWLIQHCGQGAAGKKLSPQLLQMPINQVKIFLSAYLKGDGNIGRQEGTTRIRYCTVSEAVARDVQMLLNRIGIYAWIQVRPGGRVKFSKKSERWIEKKPLYVIGYSVAKKWDMIRQTRHCFLVPIQEIKSQPYDDFVFNLDVHQTHSFLVKGVAVHNCTAPMRDKNQLHAAVVELIAHKNAQIKYSTVQNWYTGGREGKGGIYNFVTKRGKCAEENSKISWTQVETGSAITWKYPSVILQGDNSVGEFYSVALTNHHQQADTGTKMIHIGKNTRSTIVSKGISARLGSNTYRGLVKILPMAENARNFTQCDSLLIGHECAANTFPYIEVENNSARVEHEATTSKISEDQLFYCTQRGIGAENAVSMIVNGFCKQVFKELPMEFAVEAAKLLNVSLEGSVG